MRIGPVRGMRDLLGQEAHQLVKLIERARRLAKLSGYEEIILPTIESYELFALKSGGEIKERMYAFNDLGGRRVVLRPEATASVARVIATKLRGKPKPIRLFYIINAFRYDEPQKGRYREFWQAGYELIGSHNPLADGELISLMVSFMLKSRLKEYKVKLGHMGILRSLMSEFGVPEDVQDDVSGYIDRKMPDKAYSLLQPFDPDGELREVIGELSKINGPPNSRLFNRAEDVLSPFPESMKALENLKDVINASFSLGVSLKKMMVDLGFARGLAYYTGVIFEFYVPWLNISLAGGGRYDKLIELFGGDPTPASGFAIGLDRVALAQSEVKIFESKRSSRNALIIPLSNDNEILKTASNVLRALRGKGIEATLDVSGRKLSKILSYASGNYTHVIIIGKKELERGNIILRFMKKGEQIEIPLTKISKLYRYL